MKPVLLMAGSITPPHVAGSMDTYLSCHKAHCHTLNTLQVIWGSARPRRWVQGQRNLEAVSGIPTCAVDGRDFLPPYPGTSPSSYSRSTHTNASHIIGRRQCVSTSDLGRGDGIRCAPALPIPPCAHSIPTLPLSSSPPLPQTDPLW